MRNIKWLTVSLIILFSSCGGIAYTYYGIIPSKEILLGKTEKEDRSLKECEPDDRDKGKCVVLFTPEFEKIRAELIDLRERLKACESGK